MRLESRRNGDEKAPRSYNGPGGGNYVRLVVFGTLVLLLLLQSGCKSPTKHRSEADQVAYDIVSQKQDERIVQLISFLKRGYQLANIFIHLVNHGSIDGHHVVIAFLLVRIQ